MSDADDTKIINFMCNTTKKNYVKLIGHYTVEEIDHIHEFMVEFGICSSTDRIVHSVRQKENGIGSRYHDISFIKSFYDILNDPKRMSKVAVKLIGKVPTKKPRKKKKTVKSPKVSDNFSVTDFMDKNRNHPRIPLSDKSDDEVSYISASKEDAIENFNDSYSIESPESESDESTEHFDDIGQLSQSESANEESVEISAESESTEGKESESTESEESESTESEESESTESEESSTSEEITPVKKALIKKKERAKKVDEIMKRLPKQKEEPKKKVTRTTKNVRTPKQMKKVIDKKPNRPKEFREPIPVKKKK